MKPPITDTKKVISQLPSAQNTSSHMNAMQKTS